MEHTTLTPSLMQLLNGQELHSKQHLAMPLLTIGEDGYPHQAMVSAGEVLMLDEQHVRLALWQGTTTTGNLLRSGKGMLTFVWEGVSYALRLSCTPLPELTDAVYPRARFEAVVEHVREDTAKYAELTSGITIRLLQPDDVISRWEETLAELRR